jgi:hypothetical protein
MGLMRRMGLICERQRTPANTNEKQLTTPSIVVRCWSFLFIVVHCHGRRYQAVNN